MYRKLTFLTRRLPLLLAAFTLLFAPFMATTSYAKDVPITISYSGTLVPVPVNVNDDEYSGSVVDAMSQGTFGASMSHISTEWLPIGFCDAEETIIKYTLMHAAVVVTFANGDQLFGASVGDGEMCLSTLTGYFEGTAQGGFAGGTGRFEGATGWFESPFTGHNMTAFSLGFTFGPISGAMEGEVTLP